MGNVIDFFEARDEIIQKRNKLAEEKAQANNQFAFQVENIVFLTMDNLVQLLKLYREQQKRNS